MGHCNLHLQCATFLQIASESTAPMPWKMPSSSRMRCATFQPMERIFLLSPAYVGGKRATLVLNARAEFGLARRLRSNQGVPLGELFSFLSGLYFRGKLAYAQAFARPPAGLPAAFVITPNCGLVDVNASVTWEQLRSFGRVAIDESDPRYRRPLQREAARLAARLDARCEVVLLGSISTGKYVEVLSESFGERLCFPSEFVGRGDMSRGGLMLRCAAEGRELTYTSVVGAVRRGRKPPRLEPRSWKGSPYQSQENVRELSTRPRSRSRRRSRPRDSSEDPERGSDVHIFSRTLSGGQVAEKVNPPLA
jgi:hypothetical protein